MRSVLKLLFICALVLSLGNAEYVAAQSLTWANQIGGSNAEFVNDLAVDAQGANIIGGRFLDSVTFGAGSPYETEITAGSIDGYIAKYRRGGQFQWVQQIIAQETHCADVEAIATDRQGNIYVAGEYTGEIILGAGQPGETKLQDVIDCEGFVAKYKHNGELQWAVAITGYAEVIPYTIAVDDLGNVVIAGYAFGTYTLGEGEPNEVTFTDVGGFLASYDGTSGMLNWAGVLGEPFDSNGEGIGSDAQGNVYLTGYFNSEVTFGEGQANETTLYSNIPGNASSDAFLAKYDVAGTFQWVKQILGNEGVGGNALAVGPHGTVHISGYFSEEIVFEKDTPAEKTLYAKGPSDAFTATYNRHGELAWVDQVTSDSGVSASDIAVDRQGNVAIVGQFTDNLILAPGTPDEEVIDTEAPFDRGIYNVTYNAHGTIEHVRAYSVIPSLEISVALDAKGNHLMAGGFWGDFTVKEDGEVVEFFPNAGSFDVYLMQFRKGQSRRSMLSTSSFSEHAISLDAALNVVDVPSEFHLRQNYPNPFNPQTTITFGLPEQTQVTLEVYNMLGQRISTLVDGIKSAGTHAILFDASHLPGGVYVYRLKTAQFEKSHQLILLK